MIKLRLSDLQSKDVVNMADGKNLGKIIDVELSEIGAINYFVVEKKRFFWQIFSSSEPDITIKVSQIKKIGEDVILVEV